MKFHLSILIFLSIQLKEALGLLIKNSVLSRKTIRPKVTPIFSSIAEKLGGIVEFISGQTTITEDNIETTLRVIYYILAFDSQSKIIDISLI